jgi:hypothetical protein
MWFLGFRTFVLDGYCTFNYVKSKLQLILLEELIGTIDVYNFKVCMCDLNGNSNKKNDTSH